MARGPEAGLEEIRKIEASSSLAQYHLLFAAKADLLRRDGRYREAVPEYEKAIELVRNQRERAFLLGRKREAESGFDRGCGRK
jgi:RNA polymerase sigma-70 factor (ECF subfamily)